MVVLITVLTVLFCILSVLIIILILLQSDKSAGMGILGGSSQSAFGSSTADIITKITTVMVTLFMLGSLGLAVLESWKERTIREELVTEEPRSAGSGVIDKSGKLDEKPKDIKSSTKKEETTKK